jgi:2-polyprenyl-3-methyl-5-hydroxy-6-metoxy-1,4-benzoquinol methylase
MPKRSRKGFAMERDFQGGDWPVFRNGTLKQELVESLSNRRTDPLQLAANRIGDHPGHRHRNVGPRSGGDLTVSRSELSYAQPESRQSMQQAYDPHGAALLDCFRGDRSAMLICHQDGARDDVPASFWLRETMDPLEALALDLSCGHVLDVGAGAGLHALELQRRGLRVTAIDIASECIAIMRERGVRDAQLADLYAFNGGPFDTIVCLCNGLDKVGRLADLPKFLDRMRCLLAPGGQLLADSFDLRIGADDARLAELSAKEAAGRYFGEIDLHFEYKGRRGAPFSTLQVDYQTLERVCASKGWRCELIDSAGGHYLARAQPV